MNDTTTKAATTAVLATLDTMPTKELVEMYIRDLPEGEKPVHRFAIRAVAIRRLTTRLAENSTSAQERPLASVEPVEERATKKPKAKAPKCPAPPKTYRRESAKELRAAKPGSKAARGAALLLRDDGVTKAELVEALGLRDQNQAATYPSYDIPKATGLGWESRKDELGERRYYAVTAPVHQSRDGA